MGWARVGGVSCEERIEMGKCKRLLRQLTPAQSKPDNTPCPPPLYPGLVARIIIHIPAPYTVDAAPAWSSIPSTNSGWYWNTIPMKQRNTIAMKEKMQQHQAHAFLWHMAERGGVVLPTKKGKGGCLLELLLMKLNLYSTERKQNLISLFFFLTSP